MRYLQHNHPNPKDDPGSTKTKGIERSGVECLASYCFLLSRIGAQKMKKRVLFFFSLGLVASLGLGWFCLSDRALVGAQNSPQSPHPLEEINQKAKNARTGSVSDAEEYVREVVKVTGF